MGFTLLGILSSSGGGAAGPAANFDHLATQVLVSGSSQIEFASLSTYASDYKDLQIRVVSKTSRTQSDEDQLIMRVNSVSSLYQYANHWLTGLSSGGLQAAGLPSSSVAYSSQMTLTRQATNNAAINASTYSPCVIDIMDFASTSKRKTVRAIGGTRDNLDSAVAMVSSFYVANNNAIDNIKLRCYWNSTFLAGSRFSLYGRKIA